MPIQYPCNKMRSAMLTWTDICNDKALQDLPYEVETNGQGQIIMSPHNTDHSRYQGVILKLLLKLKPEGESIPELAVQTDDGVRVVDVAWMTIEHADAELGNAACVQAPEICVEVVSPANTEEELAHKRALYFAKNAGEVWICSRRGEIRFYDAAGELKMSRICSGFPTKVTLGR